MLARDHLFFVAHKMAASPDQQHVEQQQFEDMARSTLTNTTWKSVVFAHHVERLLQKRAGADGEVGQCEPPSNHTTEFREEHEEDEDDEEVGCHLDCSPDELPSKEDFDVWMSSL